MVSHWTQFLEPQPAGDRYLRWREVERSAGISRTTAWRLQKAGEFPRPYVISRGRVGYRESEIEAWKASRGPRVQPSGVKAEPRALTDTDARDGAARVAPAPPLNGRASPAQRAEPRPATAPRRKPATNRKGPRTSPQITFDF